MLACHYDPGQHELLAPELLDWCKRQASSDDLKRRLFAYRHVIHGTFVIGQWLDRPKGLFVDLLNLGGSLANFTRAVADEFVGRTLNPQPRSLVRHIAQAERDVRSETDERNAKHKERLERMGIGWGSG